MHRWNAPRCARVSRAHRPTLWCWVGLHHHYNFLPYDISINATSKSMPLQCLYNSSDGLNPSMGQLSRTFAIFATAPIQIQPRSALRHQVHITLFCSSFLLHAPRESREGGYKEARVLPYPRLSARSSFHREKWVFKVDTVEGGSPPPGFSRTPSTPRTPTVHSRNRSRPEQST